MKTIIEMIRLLRNMRKALLIEKRFQKYLLYAIGEIFLVMIGIILALQFNNWNITRNNNKLESKYLNNLKIELEKHIEIYKDHSNYVDKRLHSIDYILTHLDRPSQELVVDSMVVHLNLMQWVGNIRVDTNLYEDLINTGNLNLITNETLRLEIQDYFHKIQSYRTSTGSNNALYINNALVFYMRYLAMGHIISTPSNVDSQGKVLSKRKLFELWDLGYESPEMKEFENNLYFRRTDLDLETNRVTDLIKKSQELIKNIESYSSVKN